MRKIAATSLLILFSLTVIYSQSGPPTKAENIDADPAPVYKRGLPPNLFVELGFQDENSNGILEAGETGNIRLAIMNRGKGKAQGLIVFVKSKHGDDYLKIHDQKEINYLKPDGRKEINIPLKADENIPTREYKLEINVTEHFGYDMDPAHLVLNTLAFQGSELVFSGIELIDNVDGTAALNADGQLQAGELVKAKIVIQNIGQSIAKNIRYEVFSTDENVYIDNGIGEIGDLKIGEVGELWVTLSPNKRVNRQKRLPVFLTLREKYHKGDLQKFPLPIELNKTLPKSKKLEVKANVDDLKQKIARFEYKSKKFSANFDNIKNIQQVIPSKTVRANSVAVIFGIEYYDNLPPAPYAENDADIIKKYFKQRLGVDQVVTYDSEESQGFVFDDVFNPDYGELQKAIIKDKTELFIFYSGHGLPGKDGRDVYLFPSDGKVERLQRQGYNLNTFYSNLAKLRAKSVTVFLDACFSGASKASEKVGAENLVSMKGVKIRPKFIQPWAKDDDFMVYTSSTNEQTSLAFETSQTGLFTYYLCRGLQGEADSNNDRQVTSGELSKYIHDNVAKTSRKIRGLQSTQFFGDKEKLLLKY